MTQEDKELLLKDLCARLPYGVKGNYQNSDDKLLRSITIMYRHLESDGMVMTGDIKPYLFPLSSMTKEQKKDLAEINPEFYSLICWDGDIYISSMNVRGYDWLNKNHFDWRGLIPMGLANDATGLNIY